MKIVVAVLVVMVGLFMAQRAFANKDVWQENLTQGAAFMEANKAKDGVITTRSGLQYRVLEEGAGTRKPGPRDTVRVHYHGTLLDGTVFDSSVERGEPIEFALRQVIKGWQEGLQLMTVGDKVRLFIPSELAYGNRAVGRAITPGSTLIFDVELIAIK